MKIDLNFIKRIFNLEIKLKKSGDKIKLSKYEDLIPMYDIYSQKIYPINKQNIHYRLIDSHYRFINEEIYQWIKNLYEKYSDNPTLGPRFKYLIDLMDNYDIPTLIETSYKALYKYSPMLGLLVSICKRNSFHPYIYHLKPYYTKMELIKLGQNMNIIDTTIDPEYLIDQSSHFKICKTVSNNDVSFDEIRKHHQYILDSKIISWVCFYSWTGSFLFNKFLRNLNVVAIRGTTQTNRERSQTSLQNLNPLFYQGLQKIVSVWKNAPNLDNDYDIYRFIWDDSFIIGLKEGDIFMDRGFISTTRDPFYSPGLNGHFGLILLKIKIPKNKKGMGLFIENFSLFPREEEFLLAPYTKLKLISKNDNFKYYHTNPEFEKIINRKYEFELIDVDYQKFHLENPLKLPELPINYHQLETIILNGIDRVELIKKFIIAFSDNNQINVKIKSNKYSFVYQWFDSTNASSYDKFYYNKLKDGMLFSLFDSEGYPYLNIELGEELVINWINKIYFGNDPGLTTNLLELVYNFGRIFYYKTAMIFHNYKLFDEFNKNYDSSNRIFLNMNLYNDTVYSYLTNGTKYLDSEPNYFPFINYNLGYWYLDEYFNKSIDTNIIEKLPEGFENIKTNKELFIKTVTHSFYFYPKLIEQMDKNIVKNDWVTFNIYDKLVTDGLGDNFKPNIDYTKENSLDQDYKLIFRQPIRRL